MTPVQRCDAIAKELYMGQPPDVWTLMAERLIIQHITEAEQEAYRAGCNEAVLQYKNEMKKDYQRGFANAVEQAAKVSESHDSNDELLHEAFQIVGAKIRALKPEQGEK